MANVIHIKGAKEHNLKSIDIDIPKNKLVVITGKSGSGKSSLAFDTIYREGQRRYMESLSSYARQFLETSHKPDVEHIEGLSPTIAIEQRKGSANPRSTVATVTEIYDYLRLLFARIGKPHCPKCQSDVSSQTAQQISDSLLNLQKGSRLYILAPLIKGKKGQHKDILNMILKEGFTRVRIDNQIYELANIPQLKSTHRHTIEVVIDRLKIKPGIINRINESVELALQVGNSQMIGAIDLKSDWQDFLYSEKLACPKCQLSFDSLEPRSFSFNSPYGACQECFGMGTKPELDIDKVVPDKYKSLSSGAIDAWRHETKRMAIYYSRALRDYAHLYQVDLDTIFNDLTELQKDALLYGGKEFEGVIPNLMRRYQQTDSDFVKQKIFGYMSVAPCIKCNGQKLNPFSLAVKVGDYGIADITSLSIERANIFFKNLKLNKEQTFIAKDIIQEIKNRLDFMQDVGLNYLTLNRTSDSLSGGEAQRIRLATQVGSKLTGVTYVLDEPTIGLHPRDNRRLIQTLINLRDLNNSIILVEHDQDIIESADYIIDVGPDSGIYGGEIIAKGTPKQIKRNKKSVTGKFLSQKNKIEIPIHRRKVNPNEQLQIIGARQNNLKNITVKIPLGIFTCVTGVSGSGKSTLVNKTIAPYINNAINRTHHKIGKCDLIKGFNKIDKLITIDQSPIGKTSRSNPATYIGLFDEIRKLYAMTRESKIRGYKPGRFSFNVKGGRCESCQGMGTKKIEMHFLSDVFVECQECNGSKFNRDTLEIKFKGLNIAQLLNTEIIIALKIFKDYPAIYNKLKLLVEVGLGYLTLGQSSTTLSGGEAQRIKLASELSKRATGNTFYILDEPTTGLHFAEIDKLLNILNKLVDKGNTVVVIEHNLDVIKCADYIIDLGPEGGENGGEVIFAGVVEDILQADKSITAPFLKEALIN